VASHARRFWHRALLEGLDLEDRRVWCDLAEQSLGLELRARHTRCMLERQRSGSTTCDGVGGKHKTRSDGCQPE